MLKYFLCLAVITAIIYQQSFAFIPNDSEPNNPDTKNGALSAILNILREIKKKIEEIIHMASHLPSSITEIPDKIKEIIAHINILAVINQIKTEVNQIISDAGSMGENCAPLANEQIDILVDSSEKATQICIDTANSQTEQITLEFSQLAEEGKQLLVDIKDQTISCFMENKLNQAEFNKCLGIHLENDIQQANNLQNKLFDSFEHAKEEVNNILNNFAECVNGVQINTIKQGQKIIAKVEECIRFSTYFM